VISVSLEVIMLTSICSKAADTGIVAWDCKACEEVLLIPSALFFASDNPMQAEECSHGGLNCNFFCRTCKTGGTKEFKQSDGGFASLFQVIFSLPMMMYD
jgi:hypothetical protein